MQGDTRNAQVQQSELAPEQIQERVREMQKAVAAFIADARHERFQPCDENRDAVEIYLREHDLDVTEESLHLAFVDLSNEGKLALYEESKVSSPETKEKLKEKLPPIGLATAADLGVGFSAQQQARKRVEGGAQSSNRNSFITAAQKVGIPKVRGGRFHL